MPPSKESSGHGTMAPALAAGLDDVRHRIARAAAAAGRDSHAITLIAVTKTFDAGRIAPVLAAGHRHFGENRVQEAARKYPALRAQYPDLTLHLIGPLQTNKVREALSLFDVIHSLDREKLARKLAEEIAAGGRAPRLFVQVNTGEEPQKSGVSPCETDAFIALCRDELKLFIDGLMCIPPLDEEPALHFALLAKIAARNRLDNLSMGMSADFETAISLGATHVRVGTAIFGTRMNPKSSPGE